MKKWVCIHSHYYQPPRENPWLEYVESQESAYPFHDWNERIAAECYGPNALSRILDKDGWVRKLINNYSRISFNFGPTLLSWLEEQEPEIYESILTADRASQHYYSGHGSAIAQVYNHIIMPLANRRDKETQVIWGIRDFENRFKRAPESMWLAETAADTETLEMLAVHGIKFVILAPRQASAVRKSDTWIDVTGERIDPKHPYCIRLPGDKSITAFFYDGPVSRAVAFEGLLHNGERFAHRILEAFDDREESQLVHIATDGESYGHHHRHGEMALSFALGFLDTRDDLRLTNYGEYLEKFPAEREARLVENSSWSCIHGIERWRDNCGCHSGGKPGWSQAWRKPLLDSMNALRDRLTPKYEAIMHQLGCPPWDTRNDYITLILDRSKASRDSFVEKWLGHNVDHETRHRLLQGLEMQRQMLLMYTSCAWFFDEVSGIETIQNLKYAYRAMQLAESLFGENFESEFLCQLSKAKSNITDIGDGAGAYQKYVKPAKVTLEQVGTHFAIKSLFNDLNEVDSVYCYEIKVNDKRHLKAGRAQMVTGKIDVTSTITEKHTCLVFAVAHLGDHNITAGVKGFSDESAYTEMTEVLSGVFQKGDLPEVIRTVDKLFGDHTYSIKDLFKDDQRRLLDEILATNLGEVETGFNQLYNSSYPLMCYLAELEPPLPKVFLSIAQFVQNSALEKELDEAVPNADHILRIVSEAKRWNVVLDLEAANLQFDHALRRVMKSVMQDLSKPDLLSQLIDLVKVAKSPPFDVELWHVQNSYYALTIDQLQFDELPDRQREELSTLGEHLQVIPPCLE